jgi:alpha-pyrone synthase
LVNPVICSVGTALPPHRIAQSVHHHILESANGLSRAEKLVLHRIYHRSGIEQRYSVLEEFGRPEESENVLFHPATHKTPAGVGSRMDLFEKHATRLSTQAAWNCFRNIQHFDVASVTHIITFTCTGLSAPGLDIHLVQSLGLNRSVERTGINFMGCYAGINAMKSAFHICRSMPDAVVLLCGVELCTLHYREFESHEQLVANALFADGAAAAIVSSKSFNSKQQQLSLQEFYSEFEPSGKDEMVWKITEHGFDLRLSSYVPELIRQNIHQLITKLFLRAGILKDDISYYAIHPGGVRILQACEEALGITPEDNKVSYSVLNDYGNMSSVTLFFVLQRYMDLLMNNDKGKKMLACAFGPGLTVESMILEVNE